MRLPGIPLTCLLCFSLIVAGCSNSNQRANDVIVSAPKQTESKRITSENVVKVEAQPAELAAGSSGKAIVRLTIDRGYHVNANPPTYPYLIPTQLEIAPLNGLSASSVAYPSAVSRQFPFAEKPLAVYEGEAVIKPTLTIAKSASKGERSISAILRIQACDDQVCYPPGTIDLQIPVTIK
jgi:DsbC/DsbD-like thiol-disulfide interchange protein